MNKLLVVALALVGSLLAALVGLKLYTNSQTEAQYEAVVRYAAENALPSANGAAPTVVFVRIQKQDPPPEFLARFQGAAYTVRPGSRALPSQSFGGDETKDAQTGEPGIDVRISHITWTGLSKAVVYANGDGYVVTNESGTWRVEYKTMMVVF